MQSVISYSHYVSLSLPPPLTHSLWHSLSHTLTLNISLKLSPSLSLSLPLSHTHTLSLSFSLSPSHTHTLCLSLSLSLSPYLLHPISLGPIEGNVRAPIHRPAPLFTEQVCHPSHPIFYIPPYVSSSIPFLSSISPHFYSLLIPLFNLFFHFLFIPY